MNSPRLTNSLDDFVRRPAEHVRDLRKSGKARVLKVRGRTGVVVQDARAYQKLLDQLEEAEATAGIRRGVADFKNGQFMTAAEAVESLGKRRHRVRKRA